MGWLGRVGLGVRCSQIRLSDQFVRLTSKQSCHCTSCVLISVLSDAEDMILTTVSEENRFYLLTMQYGTDLMFGDGKSVCDEFSHVDGTAATGVFGSCVVWSIGERLV